jgi:hypothetical protein
MEINLGANVRGNDLRQLCPPWQRHLGPYLVISSIDGSSKADPIYESERKSEQALSAIAEALDAMNAK